MIELKHTKWFYDQLENIYKDNNLLKYKNTLREITIIVPTYNRQSFLLRQIVSCLKLNVSIIIADGSKESISSEILKVKEIFPSIEYFHDNNLSYVDRIKKTLDKIKTPFAMCLAEDDFLFKKGLFDATNKLIDNNNLVACFGQVLGVDYDFRKQKTYFYHYGDSLEKYEVIQDNFTNRLKYAFSSYRTATSYAVFRTENFKRIWSTIETVSCLEATEYEHAINTYIEGKLSTIDKNFWIRSKELESLESEYEGTRKTTFNLWMSDEKFLHERVNFRNRIINKLVNVKNMNLKLSEKIYDNLIRNILSRKSHVGLVNKNIYTNIFDRIKRIIVFFGVFESFSFFYHRTNISKLFRRFLIKEYSNNLKSIESEEFTDITSIIDSFYRCK